MPTFQEFLFWLQDPGIEVAVGVVTSVIAEYVPAFEKLERKWKRPVILGLNLAVPLAAAVVGVAVGYQPANFDGTFWPALVAGVLAFIGSQGKWVYSEVIKLKG